MILLFTNKEDCHPTPVIEKLREMGCPVFRLNTECLLRDYTFSYYNGQDGEDFIIRCRDTGLEVRKKNISAVWDRRPEAPLEFFENTPEIDRHNRAEALTFLAWFRYSLRDVPSLGSIIMDRPAASKILQYRIAREVGFTIPETLFTNQKDAVLSFALGKEFLALKQMGTEGIVDTEKDLQYIFYTSRVSSALPQSFPEDAFSQTVSFIQTYIPKACELRVTVVGERCFVAMVDSQNHSNIAAKTDWRRDDSGQLKWSVFYDFPNIQKLRCLSFLRRMGLNFGCFDFILTLEGEYVFLECNPNGQWLWLEQQTGLEISSTIAKWLANQNRK